MIFSVPNKNNLVLLALRKKARVGPSGDGNEQIRGRY
jgi:hypothetical protein